MISEEFTQKQEEILAPLPPEFHGALFQLAWDSGHANGQQEVILHLEDLCEVLKNPIQKYRNRIEREILLNKYPSLLY